MNITRRLLIPGNDNNQLKEILQKYKRSISLQVNPTYSAKNLFEHADWIFDQFIKQDTRYFKIAGKFSNNMLVQIIVGYRIEIPWGKEVINTLPCWCMGLMYFDDKTWRIPAEEFRSLNCHINASFEEDNCNTFYVVQKVPPKLLEIKSSHNFFTKDKYFKTLPYDRYNLVLEKIFKNQDELTEYRDKFRGLTSILPREILRPVMLLSARLDYFRLNDTGE